MLVIRRNTSARGEVYIPVIPLHSYLGCFGLFSFLFSFGVHMRMFTNHRRVAYGNKGGLLMLYNSDICIMFMECDGQLRITNCRHDGGQTSPLVTRDSSKSSY